jgi:hypothetical protein
MSPGCCSRKISVGGWGISLANFFLLTPGFFLYVHSYPDFFAPVPLISLIFPLRYIIGTYNTVGKQ